MKSIKFTLLTLSLIGLSLLLLPYAIGFGLLSSFFALFKCREIHLFFHHLTQDILSLALDSFDRADAVMGFRRAPGFDNANGKRFFDVAFFAPDWTHLHSACVQSHCHKCAEVDAYHDRAAGYASVTVEGA